MLDSVAHVVAPFMLRVAVESKSLHRFGDLPVIVHLARVRGRIDLRPLPCRELLLEVTSPLTGG